jgi:hypothetical protein
MLAVVSHLRDAGLIGSSRHRNDDHDGHIGTGKKIVYVAPMKALAQEVRAMPARRNLHFVGAGCASPPAEDLIYVESGDIEFIVNILGLSISPITLGGKNKYGTSDEDVVSSFPNKSHVFLLFKNWHSCGSEVGNYRPHNITTNHFLM